MGKPFYQTGWRAEANEIQKAMSKILCARLSLSMAAAYQVLLILLIFLRPDIHPYSNTISEWAIGKSGWLMQIAFFCSALGYLFLFLAIKNEIRGIRGTIGLSLLFLCFAGTVGVGAFVTDPYPPDFTITTTLVHAISGGLAMILLPFAALLINLNLLKRNGHWKRAGNTLKWTAFLPLLAFIAFIVHLNLFVIPLGENAVGENVPIGYPPRVMFLAYHVWLAILAWRFIQLKQPKTYSHDS
jgi:hypothetical protein